MDILGIKERKKMVYNMILEYGCKDYILYQALLKK